MTADDDACIMHAPPVKPGRLVPSSEGRSKVVRLTVYIHVYSIYIHSIYEITQRSNRSLGK